MTARLVISFILHLFALILLFLPNQLQGPVTMTIKTFSIRAVDFAAILLILAVSIYLFTYLLVCLKAQMKQIRPTTDETVDNQVIDSQE